MILICTLEDSIIDVIQSVSFHFPQLGLICGYFNCEHSAALKKRFFENFSVKTTPSRSQELLQLLRDCFGGAVPAATDGHFGLAKFQNKLDRAPVEKIYT